MSARATVWLAWALWVVVMAFGATSLDLSEVRWFWYVLTHYLGRPEDIGDVLVSGILVLAVPAYATVGAVVASLRPRNGVGWLCLALSLVIVLLYWQPTTNLALIDFAYLVSSLAWVLMVPPLPVTLMLLIFPDGRLTSRRWWLVVGTALAGTTLGALTVLFPAYSAVELAEAETVGLWISLVALLASVVAVVLRWRRSRDQERQQIKLLAYTVALTVAAVLGAIAGSYLWDDGGVQSYPTVLAGVVGLAGIALGIPVAIGVAILRYRLYDIDLLINRTLVYGALTATLVAVYFGGIVLLQRVFVVLTGQKSPLVVVASTLLIAALFNPLRRRIQAFIDRRFYRRKYDAAKTLAAFSARLRDETDLDALCDDLTSVVRDTMQPAHVSLWLRPDTATKDDVPD